MLVLLEGLLLSVAGYVLGMLLSRAGMLGISWMAEQEFHYGIDGLGLVMAEAWLLCAVLGVGLLAALVPALKAYRVNISETLRGA